MTQLRTVAATNYLEKELGELTEEQQTRVNEVLKAFIEDIRAVYDTHSNLYFGCFPEEKRPCGSCALQPHTDTWTGFAPTIYNLFYALRETVTFRCHSNQPEWREHKVIPETLVPCGGIKATQVMDIATKKGAIKKAVRKAQTAILKIVPNANLTHRPKRRTREQTRSRVSRRTKLAE